MSNERNRTDACTRPQSFSRAAEIEARASELERAAADLRDSSAYMAKWLRDRAAAIRAGS